MQADETNLLLSQTGLYILAIVLYFVYLFPLVLFILSQNKLIKNTKTSTSEISTFWTWSQLLPLWNLVAIPVSIIKINNQYNQYIMENNLQDEEKLVKYSSTWGWVYYTSLILSWVPFIVLLTLISWIMYWMNIYKSSKINN